MPPKSKFVQSTLNRKASSTTSAPVPPPLQPEEVPTPSASAPALTATPTAPRRSHSREAAPTLAPTATPLLSQEAAPTPTTTPAPPPLNEMAMVTATLVEGAPKVPLRSIRCQNKDDGTPPDNLRTISSQKTEQLVINNGGKPLDVVFSKFHNGPDEKERYDTFIRDLGCAVRDKVPMLATSFLTLTKAQQAPVMDYLKMYYNIPKVIEDGFIKIKSSKIYSAWKHECHEHFQKYGGDELPLEFEMRPEQWRYLVEEEFMNEAKQAICKRNKDNRNKNPNTINHHSGPIPMSFRAEKLIKGKNPAGVAQATINMYEKCPSATNQVEKLKSCVQEFLQTQGDVSDPSQLEPMPLEQQTSIILECFGERRGRQVRGMGAAGERPLKKRGGPRTAWAEESQKEVEEATLKAQQAKEEAEELRKELREVRVENEEIRARMAEEMRTYMAEMDKKMLEFMSTSTSSQPSVTSAALQAIQSNTDAPLVSSQPSLQQ